MLNFLVRCVHYKSTESDFLLPLNNLEYFQPSSGIILLQTNNSRLVHLVVYLMFRVWFIVFSCISLSRKRCIWTRPWLFSSYDTQECWKLFASGGQATEPSTHSRYCKLTLFNPTVILGIRFWPITSSTLCPPSNGLLFSYLCYFSCLQEFVNQFRVLLPKDTTTFKEDISVLLEKKMGLDPTTYQIGKTKVHH